MDWAIGRCALSSLTLALAGVVATPVGAATSDAPFGRPDPAVPGPVDPGFEGEAYVVPVAPDPDDPNAIGSGSERVVSGRPYPVAVGPKGDAATVTLDSGDSVNVAAADLWVMPSFIGLREVEVDVAGQRVVLGGSGIVYYRETAASFDDPATSEFDGILARTRATLACVDDEWSIGQQTFTVDVIEQGVHRQDRTLVDQGVAGLRWATGLGFNDDAGFELTRACDGREEVVPDHGGSHHTTQFLESMSRAVYLLASSPYAGEYRATIDETITFIERVAGRLSASPGPWDEWVAVVRNAEDGHDWTHRTFMMAAALGMASTLTDDENDSARWRAMAAGIARRGLGNQWDDDDPDLNGVFPERGGFDVQYQMYGSWLGQLYLGTLAPDDPIRDELTAALDRAIEWDLGRIDMTTGLIDIRGSSRVCAEDNWWSGKPSERLDPAETIRALLLWGHTQSRPDLLDTAVLVDKGEKAVGNTCPPPSDDEAPAGTAETPSDDDDAAGIAEVASSDEAGPSSVTFDTPLGLLSPKRVAAAATAGLAAALVIALASRASHQRWLPVARLAFPVVVFVTGLAILAA